ncbi:MAG: hypothetical protein BWX48_02357 [Verrucomicrobia bacterium ADurb.Bin006]|nr:MAG: hypothetical protein BWX48_02357 [Verrucomicrobia bacterium ADurb.Bin006]
MNETNLIEDLRLLSPPSFGWALAAAAVAACGLLLALALRGKARRERTSPPGTPDAPAPWDWALAELERFTGLLRTDRSRDYGIAATGVLRGYVEARYGLRAPRLTTEEFLTAAGASDALPAADRQHLGRFLQLCDLCKFGRYLADVGELQELHAAALAFVLRSRPESAAAPIEGITHVE